MPKAYPPLTAKEVIQILNASNFQFDHSRGSHHYYTKIKNSKVYTVTVPVHKGDIPLGTLKSIVRQAGVTREEFYGATKKTGKKIGLRH